MGRRVEAPAASPGLNMTALNASKRDADVDLLRIFCAFLVIVLHCAVSGSPANEIAAVLTRCSVPIFVLLSGYYMLARPCGIRDALRRSLRLFLLILVWSALYGLFERCFGRGPASFSGWINYLLGGPIHMWYLWTLIWLYLLTPALRCFHRGAGIRLYRYVLILSFLVGSPAYLLLRLEGLPSFLQLLSRFTSPQLGFVFCYLLGGYFRKFGCRVESRRSRLTLLGLLLLCAAWKIACALLFRARPWYEDLILSFYAPSSLLTAAVLFLLTRSLLAGRERLRTPLLRELAADCLGIYLVHYLFVILLKSLPALGPVFWFSPGGLSLLLRSVTVFVLSALLVSLLRRVPLLRRLAAK